MVEVKNLVALLEHLMNVHFSKSVSIGAGELGQESVEEQSI